MDNKDTGDKATGYSENADAGISFFTTKPY